jgi:UDP-glucose 4-epimerase
VGESGQIPLEYYRINIGGTINLIKAMDEAGVKTLVFSSSATVYGDATRFPNMIPIPGTHTNLRALYFSWYWRHEKFAHAVRRIPTAEQKSSAKTSSTTLSLQTLRYFNSAGAHPSGTLGENPLGIPNNLLPYLAQVAIGRRPYLAVFGNDYPSKDGTPIRDYIHITDLAQGHLAALKHLANTDFSGYGEWNLGTGQGSTVFDMIKAFSKAVGRDLPYKIEGRWARDVLDLTANPAKANKELNWTAKKTLEEACFDLWRFTQMNPWGYEKPPATNGTHEEWVNGKGQMRCPSSPVIFVIFGLSFDLFILFNFPFFTYSLFTGYFQDEDLLWFFTRLMGVWR